MDQSLGPAFCQGGLPGPSQGEEGPSQTGWTPGSAQDAVKTSEASQVLLPVPTYVGHLSQGLVPLTPRLLPTWHRPDRRWPYASPRTRGGQASRSQISSSSLPLQGCLAGGCEFWPRVGCLCGGLPCPTLYPLLWSLLLVQTGLQGFQHPGHQKTGPKFLLIRVLLQLRPAWWGLVLPHPGQEEVCYPKMVRGASEQVPGRDRQGWQT